MKTGTLFLTDDPNVTLTCYLHEPSGELANIHARPAVLVLPGGGYQACSDREAEPVALAYMAEGYQAFILRYTVGERSIFPRPLQDAEAALEMIAARADEWLVDKSKIAVIGFSAGGHLAASLGVMGRLKPAALILAYPCILESIGKILANPIPGLDDKVDVSTPPAFLFATQEDALVPVENTLAFAAALDRVGVAFELHIFQRGEHGLSLAKPLTSSGFRKMVDPIAAKWFPMSIDWLHGLWGDFSADSESVTQGVLQTFDEYGIDVAIGRLLENPACKRLVLAYIPALEDERAAKPAMGISLRVMASYIKDALPEALLLELDEKLRAIKVNG